jgi:hypothetical protein
MPQPGRLIRASSPQDDFAPLRTHVALARSLLDELERIVPEPTTTRRASASIAVSDQLAEELGRMGCRLLECAASLAQVRVQRPAAGQA